MMDTKLVNAAAGVIAAAWKNGRQTAFGVAIALESAQLLQSPETAAEHEQALEDLTGARLSLWEEERAYERLRVALESAKRGRREARARIAELEAERHVTSEALDDAVQQLRRDQVLLAEYARQRLREGIAAEARHLLDPADQAFAELACRCCSSQPDATTGLCEDGFHTTMCGRCGACAEQVCPACSRCTTPDCANACRCSSQPEVTR